MLVTAAFALLMSFQAPYDLVIQGGRVMDPETGLDAVMNVGIRGGSIARISTAPLRGARTIDARGSIVAPGFIDLHSHGQDAENYRLKALDGVTIWIFAPSAGETPALLLDPVTDVANVLNFASLW